MKVECSMSDQRVINPPKKVKTNEHANKVMKKERILSIDTDALFLPLTDASENKEIISITSDSTVVDIFI